MTPDLEEHGYAFVRGVLDADACRAMAREVDTIVKRGGDAIRDRTSRVVGGRNLLERWDGWRTIFERSSLCDFVTQTLGTRCGAVRILYFDKPPGRGWSLALHRDRTIAVQRHCVPLAPFSKPTRKAGVPHVEADSAVLSNMLTVRVHLDAMHERNGPLIVVPASHKQAETDRGGSSNNANDGVSDTGSTTRDPGSTARDTKTITCDAGDVFVMRPLLSHGSLAAAADCEEHRRVVHIELAADPALPAEFQWHTFVPVRRLPGPTGQ